VLAAKLRPQTTVLCGSRTTRQLAGPDTSRPAEPARNHSISLIFTMSDDDERVMNDTTLPKKKSSSSVAAAAPVRRKKTGRFGLADWTRLLQSSKDLAQRKGQPLRKIRWDEIRQHTSVHDGWMVVKGKVYFISPYLAYHPGGEAILKPALGKDATGLFNKYHGWVSEDGYVLCVDAFDLGVVCSLLVFSKGVGRSSALTQTHANSNSSPAFKKTQTHRPANDWLPGQHTAIRRRLGR